jgi:hypothetical protein
VGRAHVPGLAGTAEVKVEGTAFQPVGSRLQSGTGFQPVRSGSPTEINIVWNQEVLLESGRLAKQCFELCDAVRSINLNVTHGDVSN